jgi:formate hydrogenlyase transcriptional activator
MPQQWNCAGETDLMRSLLTLNVVKEPSIMPPEKTISRAWTRARGGAGQQAAMAPSVHETPNPHEESGRYETLLEMADLMVCHSGLEDLLPAIASRLRAVADFQFLNFSLHDPRTGLMQLHWWQSGPSTLLPSQIAVEQSPSGWVWNQQKELLFQQLEGAEEFPQVLALLRKHGMRTYFVVPLTSVGKRLGALGIASSKTSAYGDQDLRLLRRVAELVALAIDNTMGREALHAEKTRLQALVDVNRRLTSSLEMQRLLPIISECVTRVVPHDFTGVTLFDGDQENLRAYVLSPSEPASIVESGRPVKLQQTLSAPALREGTPKTLTRDDLANQGNSIADRVLSAGIRTVRCVPLLTSAGTVGTLNVGSKRDRAFSPEDEEILNQIAAQLAVALDNARAYREIQALKERLAEEKLYLEGEIRSELNFEDIIGESPELERVLSKAKTVAPSGSTVLILGETGTGKELIARAIHRMSKRRDATFVKVNCAAIPTGLLESELFGHEKGAFTGAVSKKIGRIELADGGTLFLDEIGDIPLELQPKLLRVLQDRDFERLGSNRTVHVDLRLVAATNRDLSQRVREDLFRSDLFYRLNVFPIHVPPLRERSGDIPLLVHYFVRKLARRMDKEIDTVPNATMQTLMRWRWPGNVRELENFIERSVILSSGRVLRAPLSEVMPDLPLPEFSDSRLESAEREHILRVLRESGGILSGPRGAAAKLGLKRTTLQSKMKKLNIRRQDYRH